jgi:exosortase
MPGTESLPTAARKPVQQAATKRKSNLFPSMAFVFLGAVSLLFWWHPLESTLALAIANEAYTHILLILPLSVTLAYLDSKHKNSEHKDSPILASDTPSSWRTGMALLALALFIGCFARWGMRSSPADERLSMAVLGMVAWWIASVIFCFGVRIFRSLLLPVCLLFLFIPIPTFALNAIVQWLQQGSAWMAAFLFHAFGEPARRDGIFIYLKHSELHIEVAQECSSIRSSCLLVVSTIVLSHLFLRSKWRKLLLILIAIPLSVAKNGLRIFVIAELGTRVDPGFLEGSFHHHGGIVFLLVALGAVGVLLAVLHRGEVQMPLLNTAAPR